MACGGTGVLTVPSGSSAGATGWRQIPELELAKKPLSPGPSPAPAQPGKAPAGMVPAWPWWVWLAIGLALLSAMGRK